MSNQANLDKKARQAMTEFLKNDDGFVGFMDYVVDNISGYNEGDASEKFDEGDFSVEEFVNALQVKDDEIFETDDGLTNYPYRFLPDEQHHDLALVVSFDKDGNIAKIEPLEV